MKMIGSDLILADTKTRKNQDLTSQFAFVSVNTPV